MFSIHGKIGDIGYYLLGITVLKVSSTKRCCKKVNLTLRQWFINQCDSLLKKLYFFNHSRWVGGMVIKSF